MVYTCKIPEEFYKDHIEMEEDYVTTRRNELRARTGLSNKDKRVSQSQTASCTCMQAGIISYKVY